MGALITRSMHESAVRAAKDRAKYSRAATLVATLLILASPFWLGALFFSDTRDYSYLSSLICVPLLAIVVAAWVTHVSQRDSYLRQLLMVGLVAHMASAAVFIWIGLEVYGGTADAFHYWTVGMQLARDFRLIGWQVFQPPYWSTNLIFDVTGIAALLIGDAMPTLFIVFALISLAGGYFFYRAFTVAYPRGDRYLFGLLVLLSPSILFWSCFIGKDAPIQCFIALVCLGFAELTQRSSSRGIFFCVIGFAGALLVRAHVAAMLAIAMTFSYVVGMSSSSKRGANKLIRLVLIPVLIAGTYFLIRQASDLLDLKAQDTTNAVQEANSLTKTSQAGGSAINEGVSLKVRVAESPFMMFRPFPWEIGSAMSAVAALESTCWLILCWKRKREIWATLRRWRDPYTGFLIMYSVVFLMAFGGSISNLGTLLRQRIMLTPIILMLLCAKQKSLPANVESRARSHSSGLHFEDFENSRARI